MTLLQEMLTRLSQIDCELVLEGGELHVRVTVESCRTILWLPCTKPSPPSS